MRKKKPGCLFALGGEFEGKNRRRAGGHFVSFQETFIEHLLRQVLGNQGFKKESHSSMRACGVLGKTDTLADLSPACGQYRGAHESSVHRAEVLRGGVRGWISAEKMHGPIFRQHCEAQRQNTALWDACGELQARPPSYGREGQAVPGDAAGGWGGAHRHW